MTVLLAIVGIIIGALAGILLAIVINVVFLQVTGKHWSDAPITVLVFVLPFIGSLVGLFLAIGKPNPRPPGDDG